MIINMANLHNAITLAGTGLFAPHRGKRRMLVSRYQSPTEI